VSLALVVDIVGDASKLSSSLKSASGDVGGFSSMLGGSAVQVAAIAGVAGVAGAAIIGMTQAAAADRDEQEKLTAAIAAATGTTTDYTAEVDAAIAAGQERAFTDSETRDALQSLVTATGDVSTATGLLTQSQDIARLAGVDLATAADAVAKAQAGQAGPLAKLIPGIDKAGSSTEVLAAATKLAAGQADTYAASSAGMSAKAGDAFGELSETIGSVFLPIMDAILPALIPIIKAFGQLVSALLPALIPLIKLVAGALGLVAGVLSTVIGWLVKLVDWVGNAIGAIGRFLSALNPLSGIKLPSLPFLSSSTSSGGAPAGMGRAASRAAPAFGSSSGPTINVYTTGDSIDAEIAVTRALRRVARLNGGVVPAFGWTGA
jgi:hypothetical protein